MFGTNDVSSPSFKPLASYRHKKKANSEQKKSTFLLLNNCLINAKEKHSLYLVLHGDFCGESVVRVPFLGEREAQVAHFVLGLQVAPWPSRVCVVGARGGKLLRDKRGGREQAESGKQRGWKQNREAGERN